MKIRFTPLFCLLLLLNCTILRAQPTNLLLNGDFEIVPANSGGQSLLPTYWCHTTTLKDVRSDTYSEDGTYGLIPGDFGNFEGASASSGLRFVASAEFGDAGFNEAFGQRLLKPLTPGCSYEVTGFIRDSFRDGTTNGGFDVVLSPFGNFEAVGAILVGEFSPTNGQDLWSFRRFTFVAPGKSNEMLWFIFVPATINELEAYIGIDDVVLRELTFLLGDVNLDGNVNLLDVAPFVALLTNMEFQNEADFNQDGVVNLLDVAPFVDLLSGG